MYLDRPGSGYLVTVPASVHVKDYIIKLLKFPQEFQHNIRRLLYSSVLCRPVFLL